MTDERIKLIIGSLLHDVGKIIYRTSDRRTHAESGYHFLKEETNIEDVEILNQVRYHHARELKAAHLPQDSLAYITYIADNIAAAMDRRSKEDGEKGFIKDQPLESVFNILNGNQERKLYRPMMLDVNGDMNCPVSRKVSYTEGFYYGVKEKIKNCLLEFQWNDAYVNVILEILEATTIFVPSSTSTNELADISLYDHVKMTAAIATCIHDYLLKENITDYKTALFKKATSFYSKSVFYLYSMDISGIQDFIYTITSKGALKGLRSRSFYLEIMMEHLIDSLLEKLFLSRVNLIYSGGGHAYILLPNTEKVRKIVEDFEREVNEWFLEMFETQIYIAGGGAVCSASDFWNEPEGSYREIFRNISKEISFKKLHRYSPKQIIKLNHSGMPYGERECSVCHRHNYLKDGETECEICWALKQMSGNILKGDFFTVTSKKEKTCLPLSGNCYLVTDTESTLRKRMKEDKYYIRSYSKNKPYSGYYVSTKLWVGDYVNGETFEELGQRATGIERIAVAKDVVISDVTLPEGLALNYDSIEISEVSDSGTKTFSKASGGNGNTIKYHVAGTADVTNKLNPEHYNETQDKTPVITVEKKGNGFVVKDSLMAGGASLKISYNANALENDKVDVNGSEIKNEATATASNLAKVDGKVPTIKADTTVYINSPRLKIEKKADSGDYEVGDNVSYTINVVNTHKGTIARNLVYTDELKTKGVQILTGTIALYDTEGYELREGGTLAGEVDYKKQAKTDGFTLTTRKHLVVDGNYDKYDLAQGKNPETQNAWNPSYVNTKKETLMSIKYDMKITDKALAGKDILNVATAVSDEALKVTIDETVKPKGPEPTPEKSVDRTNPAVGEDVTFTLRFTNNNAGTVAKDVKTKEVKENATAYNIVIDDQLQVSGAKVLAETIKISDKDGKDFTDKCEIECTITVNNTGKMLRQEMFLI